MSIELFQLLFQVVTTLAAVIWVVSSIKSTTLQLSVTIDGLKQSVDRLYLALDVHKSQLTEHEGRIGKLEGAIERRHYAE